jgi:hypothetical protein
VAAGGDRIREGVEKRMGGADVNNVSDEGLESTLRLILGGGGELSLGGRRVGAAFWL